MPNIIKQINPIELNKTFRIKNNVLERKRKNMGWVRAKATLRPNGYYTIRFNGKRYLHHRILWVLHNNQDIPKGMEMDHIDGNRANNNIDNLRIVTSRNNNLNRNTHRHGKLPGCYFNKQGGFWISLIRINGDQKYLGHFQTEQEASARYIKETINLV